MEQKDESFEDLLANLENSRVTIEKEREEIASYKQEIETLKNRLQQKEERFSEQKEKCFPSPRGSSEDPSGCEGHRRSDDPQHQQACQVFRRQ